MRSSAMLRVATSVCAVAACLAQSNTGTISGAITDPHGEGITAAEVIAINGQTGVRVAVFTNESGAYSVPNLPIGDYSLVAQKEGFRRYLRSGLILSTGQILELNAALELGAMTDIMEVNAVEPLVHPRTSDVNQLIDTRSIEALPLGNRRTTNIIQITGAAVFLSNTAYAVGGGRIQSQMVWIDGGLGQNIRIGAGQQNVDLPMDAVQEVKVLINNYPAEYGGSAGGVVTETTRSGTNQLHVTAYEYLRNNAIDAPGFFATTIDGAKVTPELRYNVFGGSAGGPIRRNKTFAFGAYEGTRRRTGSTTTLTVPTDLQRAGDFSRTFTSTGALIPIYDPDTEPRLPFAGNVIPANRLDPVALRLMNYFPRPNRTPDSITGANNFRANNVTAVTGDFLMAKLDHQLDGNNRLSGRYLVNRQNTDPFSVYPDPGADPTTHDYGHAQYLYGAWTQVVSSKRVNELRYTYINRVSHTISAGVGGNFPQKLGLAGLDQHAFPQFQFAGYNSIGSGMQERQQYPIEQHQVVDNLMWLKNRHSLKFGYEVRRSRNREVNLKTASGKFTFGVEPTGLPGLAATTGNTLASLLLGSPSSFSEMVTPALDRHSWYFAGFAQDDWAVSRNLTLNFGLRWELDTPLVDANAHMNGFDPQATNPISRTPGVVRFAGVKGFPEHVYHFDWNNFGPRIGFAWKLLGSQLTVIRGGYGVFFAHPFDNVETIAASLGFSLSGSLNSPDGSSAPFLLRNGVPPVTPTSPALDDGFGAVAPGQAATTAVTYFDRGRVSGYSHQFNVTLERQLPGSMVLQASLLGNLGRKLPSADLSINQIPPEILGQAHHSQADRPFPQFSDVTVLAPSIGVTNYYAGLLKLERRLSQGLVLVGTYTWSKFLGNTNDTANSGAGALGQNSGPYSNLYNRRADYGPLESDIEHRFIMSSVYELPFGRGRHWLLHGIGGCLAGGWSIGELTSIQTGPPLTAITSTSQASNGYSAGLQRASVSRNPNLAPDQRTVNRWFDTGAFSQPAPFTFGNEGLGIIRAPRWINVDVSLLRDFAMTEHVRLQLRGEFFNAFNHTNLNPPRPTFGHRLA